MSYIKTTELFTICDATHLHAWDILRDAREEDAVEWFRATGNMYSELVNEEVASHPKGTIMRAVVLNETGKALVIWGIKPLPRQPQNGIGWLIATNEAVKWALALHTLLPEELAYVDETFTKVTCWADEQNHVHHQWLDWMGFELRQHVNMGPFNSLFREYVREV